MGQKDNRFPSHDIQRHQECGYWIPSLFFNGTHLPLIMDCFSYTEGETKKDLSNGSHTGSS